MCAVLAIISRWNANRNTEVKSRHDPGIPKAWCSEQSPLGDGSTDWSEHTESLGYGKPGLQKAKQEKSISSYVRTTV